MSFGWLMSSGLSAGTVYFSRFIVNDCNEMGTCDWKLSCDLGAAQTSQTLLNMREANSGESVGLNRTMDYDRLPIVVGCELWEHDGGIGAGLEAIGQETITVRTGGPHTLQFNANPDEGTATLEFVVDDTAAVHQDITEAPAERMFIGAFRSGSEGHYLLTGINRNTLDAEWARLSALGLRLVDLSSYDDGGGRRYNAVLQQGQDAYALIPERDWTQFGADWKRASGEGLRLTELEVTGTGDARRFSGVFRAGSGGHYLTPALSWEAFTAKRDVLAAQGLRLVDVESYSQGGKRYFHGVFLPGTDGHFLWSAKGWTAFESKWRELSASGLRLIDVETYGSGNNRQFVAVYRAGGDGYAMYAGKGADFVKYWETASKQGLRLVDFDTWRD